MAQKRRRGYRAPANYEPSRGRKPRRGIPGDEGRGETPDGRKPRPRTHRGSGTADRAGGAGRPEHRGDRDPRGAKRESVEEHRRATRAGGHESGGREDPAAGRRSHGSQHPREGGARVFAFDADGRAKRTETVPGRLEAKQTRAADVAGTTFAQLGLGGNIVRTLAELGAESPFPIQAATIPDVLAGRHVLGRGRTGSGKTIAFGAPLVERLLQLKAAGAFAQDPPRERSKQVRGERKRAPRRAARKPKAVILAPTRELALQIDRTVQPIARSVGFYTAQLVGGVPIDPQVHALERGVDIVIGTPGRIEDLIQRRRLDLREVAVSVLDEADHMCELGFLEPVQRIMRHTPREGQKLLFSATLDRAVSELVDEFLRDPAVHEVAGEDPAALASEHRVLVVLREHKDEVLLQLVRRPGRIVVFCRTRVFAERLAEMFGEAGVRAVALHGDLAQAKRERHLARFAEGRAAVLVATDVAARGIHVDDVDLVLQADPPDDYKTYLHRSGRTGRAGKTGEVITVIPRTRQKRTRELLENAEIEPAYFGDFEPGQDPREL